MHIRQAEPADAGKLVELIADAEDSGTMMFDPGERKMTAEGLRQRIESVQKTDKSAILLAESGEELIGYVFIIGSETNRTRHSAYLAAGIRSGKRGQGIGTRLFGQVDQWAMASGVTRLELTVMVSNVAGIALYQKMGFTIEGIKRNSLKVEGEYIDEYYMAKLVGL